MRGYKTSDIPGKDEIDQVAVATLPPALRSLLPKWRERYNEIETAWRMPPARLNTLRWTFGREIAEAIDTRDEGDPVVPIVDALASALGCSRPHVYNLVNVGRIFADPLPLQHWTVLTILARLDEPERQRLLAEIPDWAPRDLLPRKRRSDDLLPQARAAEELARRAEAFVKAALDAYSQLEPLVQAYFLADRIREFDLSRARDEAEGKRLLGMIAEALDSFGQNAPDCVDVSASDAAEEDDDVFDV